MNLYEDYIAISRYARYRDDLGRRELWPETVQRYCDFFKFEDKRIYDAILNKKTMPSMRCLMTAGPALEKHNVCGYNCAYVSIDKPFKFSEVMYILMCGTGVGFSVERKFVNKLPEIAEEFHQSSTTIVVPDSKKGWARSFKELLAMLYNGQVPRWDMSKVRPKGARLITMGGRASGPEPLDQLFRFCVSIFKAAAGRKLTTIEVHDIVCKIADIIVVGGVRRSALISLSDINDREMQAAKHGAWYDDHPHRGLANNSVAYSEKPSLGVFLDEWRSLYESKCGERGIFNRESAQKTVARVERRDPSYDFGTNPCSEIILRDREFCNLSEVIVRADDTLESLKEKVEIATIMGTYQSTLTDFTFLSSEWKKNCEEERLLGVSLTGIMDHPVMGGGEDLPKWLEEEMKDVAIKTNEKWAKRLGIAPSAAITCVKPSGTVSQLCNTASGIHPRYSPFYIRNVRADKKDPLCQFMINKGIPCIDDPYKPEDMYVFQFPIKSPDGAVCRNDLSAIGQLELWKTYAEHWCEHKPSITVYYKDEEFLAVGDWVYKNFDLLSGISFLPHTDHIYKAAPYEEIDEKTFKELSSKMPTDIDWAEVKEFEVDDNTTASRELACTGNSCEV